jgi:hypothetical protein
MEKEIERQKLENEKKTRENEEMKKLSQLSPPSTLQVNYKKKNNYNIFAYSIFLSFINFL